MGESVSGEGGKVTNEYYVSLDEALASLDVEKLKAHSRKFSVDFQPTDEGAWEVAMHKAITARATLPDDFRQASHDWLINHGYSSWRDRG